MGNGYKHKMVDLTTNEAVLGHGVGWRLPDGQPVKATVTGGRPRNRTCEFSDHAGTVVLRLRWLPPAAPWRGRCPAAVAELASSLEPTEELVPLLAYGFQWFGHACQYKT
jgi:hypothetical protein